MQYNNQSPFIRRKKRENSDKDTVEEVRLEATCLHTCVWMSSDFNGWWNIEQIVAKMCSQPTKNRCDLLKLLYKGVSG